MTDRTVNKYYLYYLKEDGGGMVLTGFIPPNLSADGIARPIWSPHLGVAAWNMPLFFPTPEQAEVVIEDYELNFSDHPPIQVGRWITMTNCQRNEHPPVE